MANKKQEKSIVLTYLDDDPVEASLKNKFPQDKFPYLDINTFRKPNEFLTIIEKGYRPHIVLIDTDLCNPKKGYEWARETRKIYDCAIIGTSFGDARYEWNKYGFPFMDKRVITMDLLVNPLEVIIEDLHQRK